MQQLQGARWLAQQRADKRREKEKERDEDLKREMMRAEQQRKVSEGPGL